MTVKELIKRLNLIENHELPVKIYDNEYDDGFTDHDILDINHGIIHGEEKVVIVPA